MARMLQALKNLESKEHRQQPKGAAAAPAGTAVVAKPATVVMAATSSSGTAPVAPRVIEVVDRLDAVVGHELGGITNPVSSPAISSSPDFAFTDFAFLGQPKTDAAVVPQMTSALADKSVVNAAPAKPPCELERQIKRMLIDPIRSQPLVDLVDRLIRDMSQTDSKVLAFVSLGGSDDLHLPILQAATLLADKRANNVLVIDGDMAARSLSNGLEYGRCPGLSELIAGQISVTNSCQPTAVKQLSFLPAGQMQPGIDEAANEALEKAIVQLKGDFDCVLIDAGQAGGESSSALAQASDATYLVIELGAVETITAQAALARLRAAGARVLGCIAT